MTDGHSDPRSDRKYFMSHNSWTTLAGNIRQELVGFNGMPIQTQSSVPGVWRKHRRWPQCVFECSVLSRVVKSAWRFLAAHFVVMLIL